MYKYDQYNNHNSYSFLSSLIVETFATIQFISNYQMHYLSNMYLI